MTWDVLKRHSTSSETCSEPDYSPLRVLNRESLSQMARLSRAIDSLSEDGSSPKALTPSESDFRAVQQQLSRLRRSSNALSDDQVSILAKLERQQYSTFHRFFTLNPTKRILRLKKKLSLKLGKAEELELEREELLRQSQRLSSVCLLEACASPLQSLQLQRQELMQQSLSLPAEYKRLHADLEASKATSLASRSVKSQIETFQETYRQALNLTRMALGHMVDPTYVSNIQQFVTDSYPLAVEAGRLVKFCGLMVQPESKRIYKDFATVIATSSTCNFPSVMKEMAKARGGSRSSHSLSALDLQEKVAKAESILMGLHQMIVRNSAVLEHWGKKVEEDLSDGLAVERLLQGKLEVCTHHLVALADMS